MTYEYFITDHQGNTRVSFEAYNNGTATVARLTQENHYYPFGMSMTGMAVRTATPSNPNKHLYNQGSELQDDFGDSPGYYSTPFREYDPVLGRFTGVDPLADNFADWTPYTYAYNNPISFNDPTGLEGRNPKDGQSMKGSKKKGFKGYKGSGGGGDSYLYDYSGMGEMEPFEFEDYFSNESTEEEIEDNSRKIAPEGTSVAFEGGGDKGKKKEDLVNGGTAAVYQNKDGATYMPTKDDGGGKWLDYNNHKCGPNCKLDHFTDKDMLRAYGEVGMLVFGGQIFKWTIKGGRYALVAINAARAARAARLAQYVNVASKSRTVHILFGDATGGGHKWALSTLFNGKSKFPISWTSEKIMNAISEVTMNNTWIQQSGVVGSFVTRAGNAARFYTIGIYDGIKMKIIIEPAGEGIITAFPIP